LTEIRSCGASGTARGCRGWAWRLYAAVGFLSRRIGEFVTEAGLDGAYDFSAMTVREVLGKDEDVGKLSFIAKEAKQCLVRDER
jgi:hypothetical protein